MDLVQYGSVKLSGTSVRETLGTDLVRSICVPDDKLSVLRCGN